MINKATIQLGDKLVQDVTQLKRDLVEFKNRQPVGADVLRVQTIPGSGLVLSGSATVAAGSALTFVTTFVPAGSTLTLWNFSHSIFVDVLDANHVFPAGASLTSAQRNVRISAWQDYWDSSDVTNIRVFKVRVENYDSASHLYYIYVVGYLPKLASTSGS